MNVFKTDELLGMCSPDPSTEFRLFDRVVSVRLGTGVPLGSHGTVVGIMHGQTDLDTYYEILFDNLPTNSLEAILLGKNQQKCRTKVHSYHLLNYTHSLRMRSIDYQPQQSTPMNYGRNQHSNRTSKQQYYENNQNNTAMKPKSAPPLTTNERPYFNNNNNNTQKPPRLQQMNQPHPFVRNLSNTPRIPGPMGASAMPMANSNQSNDALFFRAIQDSNQIGNRLPPTTLYDSSDSPMFNQQTWTPGPTQYFDPSCKISIFQFS